MVINRNNPGGKSPCEVQDLFLMRIYTSPFNGFKFGFWCWIFQKWSTLTCRFWKCLEYLSCLIKSFLWPKSNCKIPIAKFDLYHTNCTCIPVANTHPLSCPRKTSPKLGNKAKRWPHALSMSLEHGQQAPTGRILQENIFLTYYTIN